MKGTMQERAPGTFKLLVSTGKDAETGKYGRVSETFKGSKRDAQRRLRELIAEVEQGHHERARSMTLAQFVETRWLPAVRSALRPSTTDGYRTYMEWYVLPRLGQVRLKDLSADQIQAVYRDLEASGGQKRQPLSRRTVHHAHRILSRALGQAVKMELLIRNPCDAVIPPRPDRIETAVLDAGGIERVLDHFRGVQPWAYVAVFLATFTGMRRSEILALQWGDVDFGKNIVTVRRAYHLVRGQEVIGEPKSRKGTRRIALTRRTVEMLHELHRATVEEFETFGRTLGAKDWLIATRELRKGRPDYGERRPYRPHSLSQAFSRAVDALGLPKGLRFHDLRHSHATLMLKAGVHPKLVSERLGHSTIGITLDLYSHASEAMQEQAAEKFEAALGDGFQAGKPSHRLQGVGGA